ncbi:MULTISPECIES: hypothetical protein [Pseudomonas]|jgi:serine/threonine-protein kinase|uniref:hypothetical protein n=1 Tax=Pseudomonas TaxID=286 RepID=UPI00072FF56D|nr:MULTISPECIES: hypothetical protein [Pseudomonas]AMO77582.1 hypothetical protein PcP3B5_41810 [Pseudomonas citronellolis]KSW22845.1 hypothetical protein AOX63_05370 [Pseudomonas sp. ADP]OBP09289.1 hypothetical protein BAE52_20230 [Pseudomonas sp. EGD-AKN5]QOF85778.1 hypothetical protein IG194_03500 [Pseudomonas sp. ADPe]
MEENPYVQPKATVHEQESANKALRMAELHISQAWIGACIGSALAAMVVVHGLSRGGLPHLLIQATGISAAVLLALALGVYRKSRVCAALLLMYQLCTLFLVAFLGRMTLTALIAALFTYLFAQGLLGCIRYHRLKHLAQT